MSTRAVTIGSWIFVVVGYAILGILFFTRSCTVSDPIPVVAFVPVTDPRFIAPLPYRAWVMQYAAEFGVPLDVAIRLAYEESGWDPAAMNRNRNGTWDQGLYQLNSRYHRVQTIRGNIREGLRFWAWCWRQTGTIRAATIAYQTGLLGMKNAPKSALREAGRVAEGNLE